jgi:hypothetical protein
MFQLCRSVFDVLSALTCPALMLGVEGLLCFIILLLVVNACCNHPVIIAACCVYAGITAANR